MDRDTINEIISIVFAAGNSIIVTYMGNSMQIQFMMTLIPLLSLLLLLLINVSEVHLNPVSSVSGGKIAKILDGKSFGFSRNFDIWDGDANAGGKRGFFEEKAAMDQDEVVREDDVFKADRGSFNDDLIRNRTDRRSKGLFNDILTNTTRTQYDKGNLLFFFI